LVLHYSLKTGKACPHWVRFFIRWSAVQPGGIRHPRDTSVQDIEAFLSVMANAKLGSDSNESHTTQGPTLNIQRLVMAQDTGGAIVGAVRADLFTGWGSWTDEAYTTVAALKQPLQMWVLWRRVP
jgi:hypothetical protein